MTGLDGLLEWDGLITLEWDSFYSTLTQQLVRKKVVTLHHRTFNTKIQLPTDYWSSVYYAGHVSLVVFGVLGMILVNPLMKIIIKQDLKEE